MPIEEGENTIALVERMLEDIKVTRVEL